MVGRLIIGKNNSFYRITKSLDVIIIRGNFNKIIIPFKIGSLNIHGNYNKIDVLEGGEINYINIFGNNNKIFSKNIPRRNYFDHGLVNTLIIKRFNFHDRNRNRDNWDSDSEESLVEKRYFDISDELKEGNSKKCTLCNETFLNIDRVTIFSCNKHIFHRKCLEEYMKEKNKSSKCPRCENNNNNLNESIISFSPHKEINSDTNPPINPEQNPRNNMENNSENNPNDNLNHSNNENDVNEEEEEEDENNNMDDEENEDLQSIQAEPLDKIIFDNLIISKIKDVEKLDNEKKQCAICLEDYVNGDKSIALPCIHIFHDNCIKNWLKSHNICPTCKNKVKFENEDFGDDDF